MTYKEIAMAASYDYYRIFYHAAKYGSFTQAARVLSSNQPNVTRAMNALEAELGCRLFVRSHKGAVLTPEGKQLYEHVAAAYEQIRSGEEELKRSTALQSGHVSIAVSEIALHGLMLGILQAFSRKYPGVRIQIFNHSSNEGADAVNRGIADLAVISSPFTMPPSLKETVLLSFQDILIAGSRFHELHDQTIALADLNRMPLIGLAPKTGTHAFFTDLFRSYGLDYQPSVEAATTDQILPLVEHDIGLGFLPSSMALNAVRNKTVFPVSLKETVPQRHISLVRDRSRTLSAAADALAAMILAGKEQEADLS